MASHAQPSTNVAPTELDLVHVSKRALTFDTTAAPPPDDTIVVTNLSPGALAYKVKTTNQPRYIVRPNVGVLPARGSQAITIELQADGDALSPGESRDRFQLCVLEAAGMADPAKPADFWVGHETDTRVVRVKFPVRFVEGVDDASAETGARGGDSVVARRREVPPDVRPGVVAAQEAAAAAEDSERHLAGVKALEKGEGDAVGLGDADRLLMDGNYEDAVKRVAELQAMLDEKNLMLAKLRAELSEVRAESEKVLKEAPGVPLSANKLLSDPFGGVSVVGFGLMFVLFLFLVKIIMRIV